MPMDKALYKKAYLFYREWNEQELKDRRRRAGERSPLESWKQYVALWEFCVNHGTLPGARQRQQRMKDWMRYYERVQLFESKRKNPDGTKP